jgi:hypothetical protein
MLINNIFYIIKNKYDIHCTIRYYNFIYPRIYVYKRYMPKLRSTVEPFMYISSFI